MPEFVQKYTSTDINEKPCIVLFLSTLARDGIPGAFSDFHLVFCLTFRSTIFQSFLDGSDFHNSNNVMSENKYLDLKNGCITCT